MPPAGIAQLRKEGKLPADAAGREAIIVKRVERAAGEAGQRLALDARIVGAFGDRAWSSKAVTRELGIREFNGVKAEGKAADGQRGFPVPVGDFFLARRDCSQPKNGKLA